MRDGSRNKSKLGGIKLETSQACARSLLIDRGGFQTAVNLSAAAVEGSSGPVRQGLSIFFLAELASILD
jgi:hypothetical protein